jgi:flagellar biosynthesis protein FlhG
MKNPIIISVGGGKGGIGKSTVIANIGALLAQKGFSIGFIDADMGGANLHHCLGVKRPAKSLQDYISGRTKSLAECSVPTVVPNSWLISGASDIIELANPKFAQKQKIIRNLHQLAADYLLIDLGAGSSNQVTDFFAAFPYGIVVADSLPTSIENAYGFLKNGILRGLARLFPADPDMAQHLKRASDSKGEGGYGTVPEMVSSVERSLPEKGRLVKEWLHRKKTFLILNMVKQKDDIAVANRFVEMVKKYLQIDLLYIGYIVYSSEIRASIRAMKPAVLFEESTSTKECFAVITNNLVALTRGR